MIEGSANPITKPKIKGQETWRGERIEHMGCMTKGAIKNIYHYW